MNRLKVLGAHATIVGTAFTAFFGFGWCLGIIVGAPATEVLPWVYYWAATGCFTLAIVLTTFMLEIADYLETVWYRPRGRHAR